MLRCPLLVLCMLMACCQAFAQEKPTTTNEEKALSPCTDLLIDSSFKTATRQPAACETSQVQKIQQEDQEKHTLAADQTPVADTYYYRIGDGQWKLSAVTGGMKAEGLRPSDFFVLTAAGSKCVSPDGTVAGTPCSLKALFVKIIYAGADPGTEDEEWHKLLEWKPDQEKLLQSMRNSSSGTLGSASRSTEKVLSSRRRQPHQTNKSRRHNGIGRCCTRSN